MVCGWSTSLASRITDDTVFRFQWNYLPVAAFESLRGDSCLCAGNEGWKQPDNSVDYTEPAACRSGTPPMPGESKVLSESSATGRSAPPPVSDLSALYRLTDRLYRAREENEVFEAALDAILDTLSCQAASILVADEAGIMRFRAWRGISEDYRKAVDGHSPWKVGAREAEPIFVADIDETGEPAWLKERIVREGIRGLSFVPLMADGVVVGKFMTYFAAPHLADERERELAITIAKQVGFALERRSTENLRRQAEERLRSSERHFRRMTEDAPVMIWTSDLDGHCANLNAMLRAFWGVAIEDVPSFDFTTTIHPDDRDAVLRAIGEAHAERRLARVRGRYRHADGSYRVLETEARPNIDETGTFRGMIGVNVDTTERVEAEQALLESERRFRQLADAMPQLVWTAKPGGRVDYWNTRIDHYADVLSHEGGPLDWQRLVHPRDLDATSEAWMAAETSATEYQFTHRLRMRDGTYRWHLSRANPAVDDSGSIVRWFGTATDIHDLRSAQEKLQEGEQRQRIAARAAGLGVFEWDIQADRTIFENARAFEILGLDPNGPTIGFREFREDFLVPGDLPAVEKAIEEAMVPGATANVVCRIRRRADGEVRSLEIAGSFVFDERGAAHRLVGVVADVTDRRRAEELRELLVDELNHRVKNTLAVVQALAKQTFEANGERDAQTEAFSGRLSALAYAHRLLSSEGWTKAYLEDVAGQTLPLDAGAEPRIVASGPPVVLSPKQAVTMAMTLHELYTNAVKYGALSEPSGGVDLEWTIRSGDRLSLRWAERGGPPVVPPVRRGFGSRMIEQALAAEFDATVQLDFRPEGLVCTMEAILARQHG